MRAVFAVALAALLTAAPVTAQSRCLTPGEAESIALVAMPDIIRDAGTVCGRLPASSLLRRTDGKFITKYEAEADRAWPSARTAIAKLSDPAVELLLLSEYARPLLTAMFAPQITGRINPEDCPMLDRVVTLIEPLPARNTAGILVAALQHLKTERARGRAKDAPDLPICTSTGQ